MTATLGVPSKLLKEFLNRKVTVETNRGEVYKGILAEVEDNMSMSLSHVKITYRNGSVENMVSVYIRGSKIRLINLPDNAKDSLQVLTARSFRGGRSERGKGRGGRGRRGDGFGGKPHYLTY